MIFCFASLSGLTGNGPPFLSRTTREQVASKPMPATLCAQTSARVSALRIHEQTACQISWLDCSTRLPLRRVVVIFSVAWDSRDPLRSKIPARTLPDPTSTPITVLVIVMIAPLQIDTARQDH